MTQIVEIGKSRVLSFSQSGSVLRTPADANDFISEAWSNEADFLAIPVERLGPDFLKLSTGVAGEVFQKFVNYGLGCAIVGDVTQALDGSGALRDFVRETNKGKSIWFVPDFDELQHRFEKQATLQS
ncbi:DUF4180 domain-containing protein [Aminobacter anthyllidis]|uniref:DUF4180 domain-containing protein n=1 Tax=Aminobacter anthyllidis TaxID=1035067 RepID=A0A9X1D3V8_9HYPH|nr:DUF4180 domain-containing protein [Aminobacter anthyllidis]MBT1155492.1 DUF4180 domain-containing protein [Aminobacter anthyllidis]MDH4985955.1 DUF4180 domain-containing protein [Aminobacter anthyllidis]